MEIAKNAMIDSKEESKVRVLSKQVMYLTKELEKAVDYCWSSDHYRSQ